MSTTTITLDKVDIVAKLKTQLAAAKAFDKQSAADHKKAESEYLNQFRDRCRAAVKWSYAEAKEHDFDPTGRKGWRDPSRLPDAPTCPVSTAKWIQGELDRVELSIQASYKAGPDTSLHRALMWDPKPVKSICGDDE